MDNIKINGHAYKIYKHTEHFTNSKITEVKYFEVLMQS